MSDLNQKKCEPCEGIGEALNRTQIDTLITQVSKEWQVADDAKSISRKFSFENFHETMAFMNAISWVAHRENHHPDVKLGYNYCEVTFMTHALGGLSQNDFICAAKVDKITNF